MATATIEAINNLKIKAQEWAKKVVELYNMPVPTGLLDKKKALLSKANIIRKSMETIFGPVDELKNVQLGILQLISAAAVITAIAAMTYWLTDFAKFKLEVDQTKLVNNQIDDAVKSGMSPTDAKNLFLKADSGDMSIFQKLIGEPKAIILPGILMFLIYKYFSRR